MTHNVSRVKVSLTNHLECFVTAQGPLPCNETNQADSCYQRNTSTPPDISLSHNESRPECGGKQQFLAKQSRADASSAATHNMRTSLQVIHLRARLFTTRHHTSCYFIHPDLFQAVCHQVFKPQPFTRVAWEIAHAAVILRVRCHNTLYAGRTSSSEYTSRFALQCCFQPCISVRYVWKSTSAHL